MAAMHASLQLADNGFDTRPALRYGGMAEWTIAAVL